MSSLRDCMGGVMGRGNGSSVGKKEGTALGNRPGLCRWQRPRKRQAYIWLFCIK